MGSNSWRWRRDSAKKERVYATSVILDDATIPSVLWYLQSVYDHKKDVYDEFVTHSYNTTKKYKYENTYDISIHTSDTNSLH